MARTQSRLEKIEAIRKEIDSSLSRPLDDKEWGFLMERRNIDDIAGSPSPGTRKRAVEETVLMMRQMREIYSTPTEPKEEKARMLSEQEAKQPTKRSEVISILVAQEASEDARVRLFRTEVLGDMLLPPKGVEAWIQQQAQKEGPPTKWLSDVPLPQTKVDELVKLMLGIIPDTPHFLLEVPIDQIRKTLNLRVHVLQYTVPDDEWVRSVPTSIGGVLERLQRLSEQLEKQYAWVQAQAISFILTGSTPLISPLSFTLKRCSHPLLNRIVLEMDPIVLPKEVTENYRNLRKEIMPVRPRRLTEKHMQLAVFASRRPKSETWAEKMTEWNKEHQTEWKYKEISNFALDCRRAQRRLLFS